jgi:hypothetical protein
LREAFIEIAFKSPLVISGSYQGQPYEVDHIIPVKGFAQQLH